MKKIMLINAVLPEETRIAIIENGTLEELYVERLAQENIVGNIYAGKIVNIEPSIQAAFVDFGIGRNGFLHISDVDPSYFEGQGLISDAKKGSSTIEPRRRPPAPPKRDPKPAPRDDRPAYDDDDDREEDREPRRGGRQPDRRPARSDSRRPAPPPEVDLPPEDEGAADLDAPNEEPDAGEASRDRGGRRRRRRGRGRGREMASQEPAPPLPDEDLIETPRRRDLPDIEDYRIEDDAEIHEEPVYLDPEIEDRALPSEPDLPLDDDDDFGSGLFADHEEDDEPEPREPDVLYRRTGPDDDDDFGSGIYDGDDDEDDVIEPTPIEDELDADEPQAREPRFDDEDPFDHLDAAEPDSDDPVPEDGVEEEEGFTTAEPLPAEDEPRGRRRRRRGRRGRRRSEESSSDSLPAPRSASAREDEPSDLEDDEFSPHPRRTEDSDDRPRPRRDEDDRPRRGRSEDDRPRSQRPDDDRPRGPRSEEDSPRRRERGDRGGRSERGRGRDDRRGGRRPQQQRWVDPRRPRERPPIQEIFRRGQEVLVQVIKEGIGNKGPTLSTYVSIPGRSLVAMPGLDRVGVSRKIEDPTERRRLRDIMNDIDRPENVGFIVRTAGVDCSADELERDLQYLSRLWEVVVRRLKQHPAPMVAYQESDVIIRTIRDIFNEGIDAIYIDDRESFERAREFMQTIMPDYVDRVRYYDDAIPMFNKFRVEEEIVRIQQRTVPLEKGGSIVIEQTEALVAIDVNSGTFRAGEGNAEETAYQMNLAAAKEIARQLRLRDLGGVIVNDFIDMREERHRRSVENTLRDAVARDRAKTKVLRMSAFGMIEMTRQRIRPSLKRHLYRECPMCTGTGHVKTIESMSIDCMRLLIYLGQSGRCRSIHMIVDTPIAEFLNNEKRKTLAEIEDRARVTLNISGRPMTSPEEVEVHCFDAHGHELRIDVDHLMIRGTVDR